MSQFGRPGVYVQETPLPVQIPSRASGPALASVIGYSAEGPESPTLYPTWTDYSRACNVTDVNNPLHRGVYQVYANGGGPVYVLRVVPTDARRAQISDEDFSWAPFTVTAASVGAWGNSLSVTFEEEERVLDDEPTTWTLTVERTSGSQTFAPLTFRRLSTDPNSGNYFAQKINQAANNTWVHAVEHSEKTVAGLLHLDWGRIDWDGMYRLDVSVPDLARRKMRLTKGSDGTLEATGFPDAAQYADAPQKFDFVSRALLMYCTDSSYMGGASSSGINQALTSYCQQRGDSFAILDTPQGYTVDDALAHGTLPSTYAAMFFPWIRVTNPARGAVAGSSILCPPGGPVTGAFISSDRQIGPWATPAGTNLAGVALQSLGLGVERTLSTQELDRMNTDTTPVNPLRSMLGRGVVIMGSRTQRNLDVGRYISVRRALNYFKKELETLAESALFQPITTYLQQALEVQISAWLTSRWEARALAGSSPAEAFYVVCDRSNNSPEDASEGRLNVDVGLALLVPAEYIVLRVGQFQGTTSISESFFDR